MGGLISKLKDSRVVKNTKELVENIIEHKSIRVWTISEDKAEYDRSKRLLDGSLKSVLDEEKTSGATREQSVAALGDEARLIILHDPCDIRKEYAEEMENLGKVRDLDGKLINGYSTFNTVAVDVEGKNLYPVDISVYSNGDEHYVTVAEMKKFEKGKLEASEDKDERERSEQIEQFVEEESYINLPKLSQKQLKEVSYAFKEKNPEISLCHVLDRQFDGKDYFEFIDQELEDEFVIRCKVSRNSNDVEVDPQTGKNVAVKLKDVEFEQSQCDVIKKLKVKKKVYQDAKCLLEWGTLTLDEVDYSVVRVTLQDSQGKAIYKQPMLLITNIKVKKGEQARDVYGIYLMRAKIESVFKFLKDVLGWEEFQVRDYESIKNIIALAFFVGGYFYEIGSDLTENPTIVLIAQLGGGKGKVTRHYFLEGLKKLLTHKSVERFIEEQEIGGETLAEMLTFVT
jgi:tRNA A37 threonylcarbamoyladenosine biosynthesis protein TsaE